jgi:hypothetical protein
MDKVQKPINSQWYTIQSQIKFGKHFGGRGRGLIEVLCQHLPGGIEEYHEKLSRWPSFRPIFETSTSRIQELEH